MKKERWHTEPDPDPAFPSKSKVKRDYLDLQDFVLRLANSMPQERLNDIEMDERLRDALADLHRLKGNNAQRRQARFVAKLIDGADMEPFHRALNLGNR